MQRITNFLIKNSLKLSMFVVSVTIISVIAPKIVERFVLNSVKARTARMLHPDPKRFGGGSGFQVTAPSGKQYTLTNAHICNMQEGGYIVAESNGARYQIKVIEKSTKYDLCLLEEVSSLSPISLASGIEIGEDLAIVGYPLLQPVTTSKGEMTNYQDVELILGANIKKELCEEAGGKYIKIDDPLANAFGFMSACVKSYYAARITAIAYPGNSGSPVINKYGNLVGVLFAANGRTNEGLMVPLRDIRDFLKNR